MNLSVKKVVLFALVVLVAYLPTFCLAGSIDGDEWIKSGVGAMGIAVIALLGKMVTAKDPDAKDKPSNRADEY